MGNPAFARSGSTGRRPRPWLDPLAAGPAPRRWAPLALGLAVAALLVLQYAVLAPTLGAGFVADDFGAVDHARSISSGSLWSTLLGLVTGRSPGHSGFYRPVESASYVLEHALWGTWAPGFRATNLALLAACALLLAHLVRLVLHDARVAAFAAVLFAAHPTHAETAAWVCGRVDSLALLGVLAAAVAVCSLEGAAAHVVGCAAFAFGLLAKEWALAGLVLLPLCAFARRRAEGARARTAAAAAAAVAGWAAVVAAAYLLVRARTIGPGLATYGALEPGWSDPGYWLTRARFVAGVAVPVPWARSDAATIWAWAGLSLAAVATCAWSRPRAAVALLALLSAAAAAHYRVEYLPETMQDARYAFACTVAWCVAVAVLLSALANLRPWRPAARLGVALILAFWLASGQPLRTAWADTAARTAVLADAIRDVASSAGTKRACLLAIPATVGGARLGHAMVGGALSPTFYSGPAADVRAPRNDVLGPGAVLAAYLAAADASATDTELWHWSPAKGKLVKGCVAAAESGLEDQRATYCEGRHSARPALVLAADGGRVLARVAREPGAHAALVAGPPSPSPRHVSACDDLRVWPAVTLGSASEDDPRWLVWDVTEAAARGLALQALVVPRHGLARLTDCLAPR